METRVAEKKTLKKKQNFVLLAIELDIINGATCFANKSMQLKS